MGRYPAKTLTGSFDIYPFELTNLIIASFKNGFCPEALVMAKVFSSF